MTPLSASDASVPSGAPFASDVDFRASGSQDFNARDLNAQDLNVQDLNVQDLNVQDLGPADPGAIPSGERKTADPSGPLCTQPFERRRDGSIRINGSALAHQILRGDGVRQAGFNADLVARLPQKNISVLFKDGEAHRRQRSAAARFFAPAVVRERYHRLMRSVSARLIETLQTKRRVALEDLSLELSMAVAGEIVGLTDSLLPGLGRRLSRFFTITPRPDRLLATAVYLAGSQLTLLLVYILDVRPAIRRRRRARRDDLITHLVDQGWSDFDILTECVTYATAGMSTTREFIVVATWHILESEALHRRFLASDEPGRWAILEEILRLEPAVGTLYRRSIGALTLDDDGRREDVAANTLIAIDLRSVNADPAAAGACPHRVDPDRAARGHGRHMSFGDGPHRCPGAAIAIQETSIFLDHLLRVPGLRLERTPTVGWNATTTGYVLRDAVITID